MCVRACSNELIVMWTMCTSCHFWQNRWHCVVGPGRGGNEKNQAFRFMTWNSDKKHFEASFPSSRNHTGQDQSLTANNNNKKKDTFNPWDHFPEIENYICFSNFTSSHCRGQTAGLNWAKVSKGEREKEKGRGEGEGLEKGVNRRKWAHSSTSPHFSSTI